ncbi:hypothetical protein [Vibrio natriegens]|uniref:hypothetical protein n=1 Tax=Vibrio natriegens TaxID=691 RepID=UPI003B596E0C
MYYEKVGRFEIRAFFDRNRDELVNKVTFRRKEVQTEVLEDRLSQSYIGYQLIVEDLKRVLNWAQIAINLLEKNKLDVNDKYVLESLFISMVTTYWKCFADTKGRHRVQLSKGMIPNTHIDIHNELRRIRHNFTAHSGDDPFESGYMLHVKDVPSKNRFTPFNLPIHRKAGHGDKVLTKNIRDLSDILIKAIKIKQDKLRSKIENGILNESS